MKPLERAGMKYISLSVSRTGRHAPARRHGNHTGASKRVGGNIPKGPRGHFGDTSYQYGIRVGRRTRLYQSQKVRLRCQEHSKITLGRGGVGHQVQVSFVVGGDGRAYEGRGWRQQCPPFPASATDTLQEFDQKTIYIGLIEQQDKLPSKTLLDAVTMLISQGVVSMYLHKDVKVHALKKGNLIPFSKRRL